MNKKVLGVLMSCALAGTLFTGCGNTPQKADNAEQKVEQPAETSEQKVENVKIGMLARLNANSEAIEGIMTENGAEINVDVEPIKFYNSLSALQAALDSDEINQISTYKSVAECLIAQNPKLEIVSETDMSDSLCFVLRDDNEILKRQIDIAIEDMTRDGVLERFIKDYVTEPKQDLPPVTLSYSDALTPLRFVVTGDLPPVDMFTPEGEITGFNAAVLNELGRRLAVNIEVVKTDSASRAEALLSNEADVVFWAIVPSANATLSQIDLLDGLTVTDSYFKDKVVRVGLKK